MTRINAARDFVPRDWLQVELAQTIEPWQCVGCGRLQAERPCIGVLRQQDRTVRSRDYAALAWRVEQLESALALIARITPKPDRLEASWHALQSRARALLDEG